MRGSDLILALGVAVGMIGPAASAFAEPPRRVVSMNLCTDQLAMLVAAPGQLLSVSRIARDPRVSALP
jgi:iron complex transport system substrate-binding protein